MRTTLITSTQHPRLRLGEIARAARRHLSATGAAVTTVETDALPHSALLAGTRHPAVRRAEAAVAGAEALVIVTPRYEPSGSDPLRTLLADLPARALRGKPVLPVGLGAHRAHAAGLTRIAGPPGRALPGCFLHDTWLEKRLGRWQLTADADDRLAEALAALRAGSSAEPQRLAS
ncbi:NAD(P)H-dependent oxidoreductase [Saccharopolyspora griseoalba]|uniref:NAD(P)H-dependent oxidoreductase n=1 Tax=Saccharopolyspora griseoalba TaxID=1431848 RepID=A0ABW2LKD2_9PSEU